jgi:cell division protein FtsI/penicillin-binding protein 2
MGIALDTGAVQQDSTYDDTGSVEVGGVEIQNWDRQAHGVTTMTDLLAHSLNVGAAKVSLSIGPTRFYRGLDLFGMGKPTGIDLEGEVSGLVRKPGQTDWHEADLAENSFGQALAATPIQMLVAVASIANDGLMMQPHIVAGELKPGSSQPITYGPTVLGRTVSQQTARTLSAMLADGLRRETKLALVPGYSIAGKTGTAQIPVPYGGYDDYNINASFIGWGPVDDPRFLVYVWLEKPQSNRAASVVAAPIFRQVVEKLIVLMGIPPDVVRQQQQPADPGGR